jgi:hypothetical protein
MTVDVVDDCEHQGMCFEAPRDVGSDIPLARDSK